MFSDGINVYKICTPKHQLRLAVHSMILSVNYTIVNQHQTKQAVDIQREDSWYLDQYGKSGCTSTSLLAALKSEGNMSISQSCSIAVLHVRRILMSCAVSKFATDNYPIYTYACPENATVQNELTASDQQIFNSLTWQKCSVDGNGKIYAPPPRYLSLPRT
tara:strand:- start:840 stop:1322 length:483 start_codon:yes stop_codon:yes gene_type:complete